MPKFILQRKNGRVSIFIKYNLCLSVYTRQKTGVWSLTLKNVKSCMSVGTTQTVNTLWHDRYYRR